MLLHYRWKFEHQRIPHHIIDLVSCRDQPKSPIQAINPQTYILSKKNHYIHNVTTWFGYQTNT